MNTTNSNNNIYRHVLHGHTDSVTCLAYSSASSLLGSGSADRTVRLWDLRTYQVALGITIVTSTNPTNTNTTEITSLAFSPIDPNRILISTSSGQLLEYDTRYYTTNKILVLNDPPTKDYSNLIVSSEEINQVAVTTTTTTTSTTTAAASTPNDDNIKNKNTNITWIATADDHGDVNVIRSEHNDTINSQNSQSLLFRHEEPPNVAMVTTVAFQPQQQQHRSPLLLASAGTDCKIKLWDITNKTLLSSYSVSSSLQQQQLYNPPFVHSISWSSTGNLLASGLGDSTCLVCHTKTKTNKRNKKKNIYLDPVVHIQGHSSAIACVHFPVPTTTTASATNYKFNTSYIHDDDRWLLTAGNDGLILLWDLLDQKATANTPVMDTASQQAAKNPKKNKGNRRRHNPSSSTTTTTTTTWTDEQQHAIPTLDEASIGIPHNQKPNCITSTNFSPPNCSSTCCSTAIFVADTTKDVSVYTIR